MSWFNTDKYAWSTGETFNWKRVLVKSSWSLKAFRLLVGLQWPGLGLTSNNFQASQRITSKLKWLWLVAPSNLKLDNQSKVSVKEHKIRLNLGELVQQLHQCVLFMVAKKNRTWGKELFSSLGDLSVAEAWLNWTTMYYSKIIN